MKDYIKQAIRTAARKWHPYSTLEGSVRAVLRNSVFNLIIVDDLKKHLFYGKFESRFECSPCSGESIGDRVQPPTPFDRDIIHGILGIMSESGELGELLLKVLDFKEFDLTNLKEELGDIFWYMAQICEACGWTFEEIQELNIKKLKARYSDKFTKDAALNRDLEKERKVLENG